MTLVYITCWSKAPSTVRFKVTAQCGSTPRSASGRLRIAVLLVQLRAPVTARGRARASALIVDTNCVEPPSLLPTCIHESLVHSRRHTSRATA